MAKKTVHTAGKSDEEEDFKKLGHRIKAIRISQGYTSSEAFANEKGIHRAQYSRYEQGDNLYYNNLLKVIRALNVTIAEFFSEGFDE